MTDHQIVIIGAGPAGLTAAYQLAKRGIVAPRSLEADDIVGGISRTVERDGWRFDIGGHRFFTKVPEVEALWHEILPDEDFLLRPRMSRIYYDGKFFDYPLRAVERAAQPRAGRGGPLRGSYLWARVRAAEGPDALRGLDGVALRLAPLPHLLQDLHREGLGRAGRRRCQADWAAQRIKNLSLGKAVVNALLPQAEPEGRSPRSSRSSSTRSSGPG